jgi:hypothetical protein
VIGPSTFAPGLGPLSLLGNLLDARLVQVEMTLDEAIQLAVKVLSKTMDSTTLTGEKRTRLTTYARARTRTFPSPSRQTRVLPFHVQCPPMWHTTHAPQPRGRSAPGNAVGFAPTQWNSAR